MTLGIQIHTDKVSVVCSPRTWMEGAAIQQLVTTSQLPGMLHVVGMPDLHPGRGYPVGAAFFSQGGLYPALVGNDIGCGMSLWSTRLEIKRLRLDKLERQWRSIDDPLDSRWDTAIETLELADHPYRRSLGTIGGGNHFAEILKLDTTHDAKALADLGLDPLCAVLLVHSGSRGLGEAILRRHTDRFGHRALADQTPEQEEYLQSHGAALRFAHANRHLIAQRTLDLLRIQGSPVLDVHHNMVLPGQFQGQSGWIHRKGATPSDVGPVIIPGSRGDYSYLVAPTDSTAGLSSLAHGAGRKWGRGECKGRLIQRYTRAQLSRTALGSRVICEDHDLIFEEAPEAYKGIDGVVGDLVTAGLARVLARFTPVLTYKTRRGPGCCP